MTGQIHRRNEKILRNVSFTNFDFLELSELYIHSGELTKREIAFLRESVKRLGEARRLCDADALPSLKKELEERIAKFLGEARYKRLKSEMELCYLEYCDRYLESSEPLFDSEPTLWSELATRLKTLVERLIVPRRRKV
ncbi:MAG: hypothetical protein NZM06_10475 [Chloroherpetonaceae bacterium]|nr:hypothetical protein [Chloroherpetonaceae bacterium]MDW8437103.1 hypothetical protein [Chloroherpetonaceae bacterium]